MANKKGIIITRDNFKKLKKDDWIIFEGEKIGKVLEIFKNVTIIKEIQKKEATKNFNILKVIKLREKNFYAIAVRTEKREEWFRLHSEHQSVRKILDKKEVGNLKTDLLIRRYIKLKGLDK